jgi:hypothetical protein
MDLTALGLGFRPLSTFLQSTDLSSFWLICVVSVSLLVLLITIAETA